MLLNLHIKNLALIEELEVDFTEGLNIMTGETGAGKSIILGAIGLLLGQRADSKSIKHGSSKCIIEAVFNVEQYGLEHFFEENELDFDGKECIVRRELSATGKSRAFINDTPASLTMLKDIGEKLLDVHSQHQNLLLNKEDFLIGILDIIGGCKEDLTIYQKHLQDYKSLCKELERAEEEARKGRDEEEYMRFQANQLAEASLKENEQSELENEAEILSHAEDIKTALYKAHDSIASDGDNNTLLNLKTGSGILGNVCNMFAPASELVSRIESCYIELKDIADELEGLAESVDYNPMRLDEVNERLNLIYSLEKKHHVSSVDELLKIQNDLEERLALIDNSDENIEQLKKKCSEAEKNVIQAANILTSKRTTATKKVEEYMVSSLAPLGMPNVRFKVEILSRGKIDSYNAYGADKVNFLFSANKNGALQNVAQVASGGEIARVMLSLKSMIAGAVKLPTIIFDEIDTGVSGGIAEKMARIMKDMGRNDRQVISITHLPQIAALGNTHYKVYKTDGDESTTSHIVELNHEQRVEELANMLSGETLTEAAIKNANELLSANEMS